jgi:hypothetical protein
MRAIFLRERKIHYILLHFKKEKSPDFQTA